MGLVSAAYSFCSNLKDAEGAIAKGLDHPTVSVCTRQILNRPHGRLMHEFKA
jgi:hypothetical protein